MQGAELLWKKSAREDANKKTLKMAGASFVIPMESQPMWTTQMNRERYLGSVMIEEREIQILLLGSVAEAFWLTRPVGS